MITEIEEEINCLDKIGAEIMEWQLIDGYYCHKVDEGGWQKLSPGWSPATNPTHTLIVLDTFPMWKICKTIDGNYRAIVWTETKNGKHKMAHANTPALAGARVYGKAWGRGMMEEEKTA